MRKPGFGIVTSVLTALCVVGFVSKALRPHIPAVVANRMSVEDAPFLNQAQSEAIDWKALSRGSVAEARRTGKPIFLVIGATTSPVGQILDQEAFTDREVAGYLRRNFYCIRIDGDSNPAWLNAMLPLRRLSLGFQPDLQIWILDPTGAPFANVLRTLPDQAYDDRELLPILIDLRHRFDDLGDRHALPHDNMQSTDLKTLDSLSPGPVPFSQYTAALEKSLDLATGGFGFQGIVGLHPMAWRYFLATGNVVALDSALRATLHSPMTDLLDGGFFHTMINSSSGRLVEFDKHPVENAEAMMVLAQANALAPDPEKQFAVDQTWNYLVKFARKDDRFAAGQYGPENPLHRSDRYSFSSNRLREVVSSSTHDWVIDNLGLNVARFPQAVPFRQSSEAKGEKLKAALEDLRDPPGPPPVLSESGLADINLTCAARAIQTARVTGSRARLNQAIQWLEDLEDLHEGDDILSQDQSPRRELGSLGDYLAYADARLQDYLTTGHVRSFEMGLSVLRQARLLFAGTRSGIFVLNRPDERPVLPNTSVPEIADNTHESCTARMIRLLLAYGRLIGDRDEGAAMQDQAHVTTSLFGQVAVTGGPLTAGFFCAAAAEKDRTFAIAVGPEAQQSADALARMIPTRLVAPAFGMVRQDLQKKSPGIYVIRNGVEGPFSVDEAAQKLQAVFKVRAGVERPSFP